MALKVDFKPQNQSKVIFFSNKGEAFVFWLSLAALIFLAILLGFRYFAYSRLEFDAIEASQSELLIRVQYLEEQNKAFEYKIERLNSELNKFRSEVD